MTKIIMRCYDNNIDSEVNCFNYRALPKNSLRLPAATWRHTGYDRAAAFSEAAYVLDLSSGELEFGSEMIVLLHYYSSKSICTVLYI